MNIVFLDAYTMNPGDLDFSPLSALGHFVAYDRTSMAELEKRTKEAQIVIVNKFPINKKTLALMPKVTMICVAATGYNNIDIDAVKQKNIAVSNVKGYSTHAVAQHVFASIFAITNRIEAYGQLVKQNKWANQPDFCFYNHTIQELENQTIGIIGHGEIGKQVAKIALSFGMHVLIYNRSSSTNLPHNVVQTELDDLLKNSDIVTLHVPLTAETKHLINQNTLTTMKKNAILINTARGPLIDDEALAIALDNQTIAAAVLDVLTVEPPEENHLLTQHPQCIVTPHIAWAGINARKNLLQGLVQNISSFTKDGVWINRIW